MAFFRLSISVLAFLFAASVSGMKRNCGMGHFAKGNKCIKCPPGTYQQEKNATSCTPCPPGTYNPYRGAVGLDVCVDCKKGTFNAKPGATSRKACKKCPSGEDSPAGSPSCISCPPGKFISGCERRPPDIFARTFRGTCLSCDVSSGGSYCEALGAIKLKCIDCSPNTFSSNRNAMKCKKCPKDTRSGKGASKCSPGNQCPAGSVIDVDKNCRECMYSMVSDGKSENCKFCRAGYVGNAKKGAEKCVPCPFGTYGVQDESKCFRCKKGENSFARGATFCIPDNTPCPPNYFQDRNGACSSCTARQRFDKKKKRCVRCPKNHLSKGGIATKCTPCPKGTDVIDDLSGTGPRCRCKRGWGYGDGEGLNGGSCVKCLPGTSSPGDMFCDACVPDSYAPKAGMDFCLSCPAGTHQPLYGQTKCIPDPKKPRKCGVGLIKSKEGACVVPSTNCPPKHNRISLGEYSEPLCNPRSCPKGTGLIGDDYDPRVICGVCSTNARYDAKLRRCKSCDPTRGFFSEGGLSSVCKKCPEGMEWNGKCRCGSGRRMEKGKCVKCPPGTFGYNTVPGCETCAPGRFTKSAGNLIACDYCPKGSFSEAGASACKRCPKGTTTFGVGDSACTRLSLP